jgi:hypothetical protein
MRQLEKINLCNGAIKIKFTNDTYLVMAETGDVARYSFFYVQIELFSIGRLLLYLYFAWKIRYGCPNEKM